MKDENKDDPGAVSPADKAPCRVCCELIKVGATKCTHCDSYQDWTQPLLRWSTFLVSVIAVLPLWGIAGSLYKIAFADNTANIEAVLTSCARTAATVAFVNSGKRDGIITDVNFEVETDGNLKKPLFEVRPVTAQSNVVITPNQPPVTVTYKPFVSDTETIFLSSGKKGTCFLVANISWIDFQGVTKQFSRKCPCPS